jgi:hypothetical protein
MEQSYWLERKRAAAANARQAASAEARLAHLELAGRYSVKAAAVAAAMSPPAAESIEPRPALALPQADGAYYQRLETGARWLASRTASEAERHRHLAMANRYARLRLDTGRAGR